MHAGLSVCMHVCSYVRTYACIMHVNVGLGSLCVSGLGSLQP